MNRCMLDIQTIQSPRGPYLATLPIHRHGCACTDFDAAVTAFSEGPVEEWMEGRWWASVDGGVLEIGSKATPTGRIEVPLGLPRLDRATRRDMRSRQRFFQALGLDWVTVYGIRHQVFGDLVLVHQFGEAPSLHIIPADYREFIIVGEVAA